MSSIWTHKWNKWHSKCTILQQRSSQYLEHLHLYWKCQAGSEVSNWWGRKLLMELTNQQASRISDLHEYWQSDLPLNNETPIVHVWQAQWPKCLWQKSQLTTFNININNIFYCISKILTYKSLMFLKMCKCKINYSCRTWLNCFWFSF